MEFPKIKTEKTELEKIKRNLGKNETDFIGPYMQIAL